jgi:glycosyltransferase involved in cell wall biosynthesis
MRKIAIIDHVGAKAGLDYYSSSLAMGMVSYGVNVVLISNFTIKQAGIKCFSYFGLHQKSLLKKAFNFYNGFLFAGIRSRFEGAKEAIIHLFSFGYKDLIAVLILRSIGLKLHAIVHDVEGFEENDKPWIQSVILGKLIQKLSVHNEFSKEVLGKKVSSKISGKTKILNHGHFHALPSPHPNREEARNLLGFDDSKTYFLFFGQIKQVKGLDLLIEAFAEAKIKDSVLVIAGKPWKADYEMYADLIREKGIEQHILGYIRFIEDDERDLFFKACDVLVLPYRKIYQSGVLLMATSYRIPVIVSDLSPNVDLIEDRKSGLVFESGNTTSLKEKLIWSSDNKDEIQEFADTAWAALSKSHDWKKIARGYLVE